MLIGRFYAMGANNVARKAASKAAGKAASRAMRPIVLVAALALAACAVPDPGSVAQAPVPPKEALAFDDAVDQLTVALFAGVAKDPAAVDGRTLVIDPLIDRGSGNQSVATRAMEQRIVRTVRDRFAAVKPQQFSAESLQSQPLILVGSITPVAGPGIIPPTKGPTQTYRIWASLADLRTNRIVSHATAWVRADGVDMTPTAFFRDSPTWLADRNQAAYLGTCAANAGEAVNPSYIASLFSAAAVADGVKAYEGGRYQEALSRYTQAKALPAGDQLRVFNGIYLANAALNRKLEAEQAFGSLVAYGLENGKLAVKFVFRPNATQFWPDQKITGAYPMWLRQIASRSADQTSCLRLVGHTSPTGTAEANQALSLARAQRLRQDLVTRQPGLDAKADAQGRGSAEPIVGSGRDDATDVLDRRVEFEVRPCAQAGIEPPRRG